MTRLVCLYVESMNMGQQVMPSSSIVYLSDACHAHRLVSIEDLSDHAAVFDGALLNHMQLLLML